MKTIDLDPAVAEDALVRISRHAPPNVEIGRPLVAMRDENGAVVIIVDTGCFWWDDGGHAARLEELPEGRVELVEYTHGVETSRSIASTEDPT